VISDLDWMEHQLCVSSTDGTLGYMGSYCIDSSLLSVQSMGHKKIQQHPVTINARYVRCFWKRSMDLSQIFYANSTSQDKQNVTRISFIAPSKLEL